MAIIRTFEGTAPKLERGVFLADNVSVIGDVHIGEDSNLWYGTVVRGDVGRVRIGRRVNIQDLTMVHMTESLSEALIDDDVSIGHTAIIHGAILERGVLVGMGAIVMDNARIGENSVVGAGSLVTGGKEIPPGVLAMGRPAKVIRDLRPEELLYGRNTAEKYVKLARKHIAGARID